MARLAVIRCPCPATRPAGQACGGRKERHRRGGPAAMSRAALSVQSAARVPGRRTACADARGCPRSLRRRASRHEQGCPVRANCAKGRRMTIADGVGGAPLWGSEAEALGPSQSSHRRARGRRMLRAWGCCAAPRQSALGASLRWQEARQALPCAPLRGTLCAAQLQPVWRYGSPRGFESEETET
jgi:hypothetical protein